MRLESHSVRSMTQLVRYCRSGQCLWRCTEEQEPLGRTDCLLLKRPPTKHYAHYYRAIDLCRSSCFSSCSINVGTGWSAQMAHARTLILVKSAFVGTSLFCRRCPSNGESLITSS